MRAPFARAMEAIAAANAGDVVALGKGVFDEAITVKAGVTLWGACVAETVVRTSTPASARASIIAAGDGGEVRNLRITGALEGIYIAPNTSMHVESVAIDGTRGVAGISVQGRSTIRELAVRNTQPLSDGNFGRGLNIIRGANADVQRAVFERNHDVGVFVGEASAATMSELAISETSRRAGDSSKGRALVVRDGSELHLFNAAIEENYDAGIAVYEANTKLIMEDVVVRNTRSSMGGIMSGMGLVVFSAARVEGARVRLWSNTDSGLLATEPETYARLSQLLITDTIGASDELGQGITAQLNARVEISKGLLARNRAESVRVHTGASIDLREVTIRETKSRTHGLIGGRGIDARERAKVTGDVLLLDQNRETGIFAGAAGTEVVLNNLTVRDMLSQELDRGFGVCLSVTGGAQVQVANALFERCKKYAIAVQGSTTALEISDLRVLDTQLDDSQGRAGFGMLLDRQAHARVTRALFERNRDVAIYADGGPQLELEDLVVRDTRPSDRGTAGAGLWIFGGRLVIRRAELDQNRHVAIALFDDAELDATDLRVTHTMQNPEEIDYGYGLAVDSGHGVVERAVFDENTSFCVALNQSQSRLQLTDVVISNTRGIQPSGIAGIGLFVGTGAEVSLDRSLIAKNAEAGVLVFGRLHGEDVVVEDTFGRECARTSCAEDAAGFGVVSGGGSVELTRFVLRRSALAGISLQYNGVADLHDGEVSGNPIGANIQTDAFDVRRLQDRVIFRDNELSLDARALPVPDPSAPVTSSISDGG